MSGGGGKGGSETTTTEIPTWIRDPAIRNLARAEAVQRIPYMPYYGGDVAAFTPTQNAAFDANIGAGEAFGLLAPGHGLTATSGMPTPTDFDGFTGYSSQPMYESALAELKAKQPGAVAQYNALFGANVPTQRDWGGGGSRFRGSANVTPSGRQPITTSGFGDTLNFGGGDVTPAQALDQLNADRSKIIQKNPDGSFVNVLGTGDKEAQDAWKIINAPVVEQQRRDDLTRNFASEEFAPLTPTVTAPVWDLSPGHPSNRGKY